MIQKDILVKVIIAILVATIALAIIPGRVQGAAEAAESCAIWKSIISDISGGVIEGC